MYQSLCTLSVLDYVLTVYELGSYYNFLKYLFNILNSKFSNTYQPKGAFKILVKICLRRNCKRSTAYL